jgi:hypothetical protein
MRWQFRKYGTDFFGRSSGQFVGSPSLAARWNGQSGLVWRFGWLVFEPTRTLTSSFKVALEAVWFSEPWKGDRW